MPARTSTEPRPPIVVVGEALIDRIIDPNGTIAARPGGGPFNIARTVARLGGPVAFVGRLSSDAAGVELRAALARDGVDLRWAPRCDDPTTTALARLDGAGVATYAFELTGTSAAGLRTDEVEAALASPAGGAAAPAIVHVGSLGLVARPIADAVIGALAGLTAATLVSVDPNCRPAAILDRAAYLDRFEAVVRRADIVKLSREDARWLWSIDDPSRAAATLLEAGAGLAIVTDGPGPVRIATHTDAWMVEPPPIRLVDTVGAGDAFAGATLAHWLERGLGRPELADRAVVDGAVGYATLVAALTCTRAGADPPSRAEVAAFAAVVRPDRLASPPGRLLP